MSAPVFYILDVFTDKKYTGNQLAVFRHPENLSDSDMQNLAREMNYSETTFILSEQVRDGGYDVRIFTPESELPFAGHPTLGTAYVIQREIIGKKVEEVKLNLKVGQIPVKFSYGGDVPGELWMHQLPPKFGQTFAKELLSRVLNLDTSDIDDRFPIQEVSTGTPFILVPIKSLTAVRKAVLNRELYFDLVSKTESKAVFFFAPETYSPENQLNARLFADYLGVPEDPATGSANGCLAGYLARHCFFGSDKVAVRVEQGYEINRPSLLKLRAHLNGDRIEIFVGGSVVMTARGELV
ncbi:MAG: PhzF family phenazine biosynthesis protein [Candidatus Zixiibacteriota bacterium]